MRLLPTLLLLLGSTAAALAASPQTDDDQGTKRRLPRVRLGGIMVNAGYSHWSGGGWGRGGYWGPYWGGGGPFFGSSWLYGGYPFLGGGPFFYPGFLMTGFAWGPDKGEVKLSASNRDAEVFIDGAYAGTAAKLKTMWLDPGVYNLELRPPKGAAGDPLFQKKIYVLTGKSLRLEAR